MNRHFAFTHFGGGTLVESTDEPESTLEAIKSRLSTSEEIAEALIGGMHFTFTAPTADVPYLQVIDKTAQARGLQTTQTSIVLEHYGFRVVAASLPEADRIAGLIYDRLINAYLTYARGSCGKPRDGARSKGESPKRGRNNAKLFYSEIGIMFPNRVRAD